MANFLIRGDVPVKSGPFEMTEINFFPQYRGLTQTLFNLKTEADLKTGISRHS